MTKKNFGTRSKSKRFRPTGGMRAKLLKKGNPEAGREDMENGRLLNEPVYDKTHEAEILKAENEAAGIKEKPKERKLPTAEKPSRSKKRKKDLGLEDWR